MGLSQLKLADLADTAPNYIAMIEAEKRFPTDTMLEKIAAALQREPCELFAVTPLRLDWRREILTEVGDVIAARLADLEKREQKQPCV
jgi:transcriptional regulator with XRE-family HTH domain